MLYTHENALVITAQHHIYVKYAIWVGIGVIVIFLETTLFKMFMDNDNLIKGAKLAKENADLSNKGVAIVQATQEIAKEVVTLLKEELVGLANTGANKVNHAVIEAFKKTNEALHSLKERMDTVEAGLNETMKTIINNAKK